MVNIWQNVLIILTEMAVTKKQERMGKNTSS